MQDKIIQIISAHGGTDHEINYDIYGLGESGTMYCLIHYIDDNKKVMKKWEKVVDSPELIEFK